MRAGMGDVMAPELVWRGCLHLGEEPGIYGDASYVGLCVEWPLTLQRHAYARGQPGVVTFQVTAQDVSVFRPYPGHRLTVWRYVPAPTSANALAWTRTPLQPEKEFRMVDCTLAVDVELSGDPEPLYLGVRIEVDPTFRPGLYDDFVLVELSMLSTTFYSALGFQYDADADSSATGTTLT